MSTNPPPSRPAGEEPDLRWALANERTLLAYERTAVGLLIGGLAVAAGLAIADAPAWLSVMGLPLLVLGAAVGLEGRHRFLTAQRAIRTGEPLGPPAVAGFLPWAIVAVAAIGVVAAVVELSSG